MSSLALQFNVLAQDNASKTFRDVGNNAERAGKQTGTALGTITNGLKSLGPVIAAAGIGTMFVGFVKDAADAARVGRLTEQVIKSTGGAANVTAKQVSSLAEAISAKTGADDEAVQSASNLLLTFTRVRNETGKGNDIFNQATQAALDMSVAMGTDANSAALQLGKALNDPIAGMGALARAGVQFTAQQKEQIRTLVESGDVLAAQKIVLGELETQFGGAAEAASDPMQKLATVAENLGEAVGTRLLPYVEDFATFATDVLIPAAGTAFDLLDFGAGVVGGLVDVVDDLPGPVLVAAAALGAVALLKGPVGSAFETIALKALYAKDAVAGASVSMGALKTAGSGLLGFFGGPWGLAIAGAAAGIPLLVDGFKQLFGITDAAAGAQRRFTDALKETGGVIDDTVRDAAQGLIEDAEGMVGAFDKAGISSRDAIDGLLGNADAQRRVNVALQDYITVSIATEGRNNQNAQAAAGARDAYADMIPTLDQARQNTDFFGDSADHAASATGTATTAVDSFSARIEAARGELDEGKRAIDEFKLALDLLTGANVSAAQLTIAFHDAVREASTALEGVEGSAVDAAGGLNTQSEAGSRAADVLFDIRDRANDYIATMIQQGATTDEVVAKDAEMREAFIQSAEQMGFNRQQAENLAVAYYGIPEERNTEITADTSQATNAIANLQARIDGLRGRTVDIIARAIMPDLNGAASGSGRPGFADGGFTGEGSKYTPAGIVHAGEFVFTKEQTKRAGVGRLSAMAKSLKGYAGGGPVAPVSIVAELNARAYDTQMNALAQGVIDRYEPVQGFVKALQWVRSQVGRPYIWGGVGPAGFDCSGLMSAITNVIRGRSPNSRVGSTASFPWPGFGAGSGLFTIGSTSNAGGGIGHMAGTLLGINVESTGGVGVRVGASARGALNGLFNERASLRMANGGVIGEPVSGIGHYSGRSYSFGERGPETLTPGLPGSLAGIEVTGRLEFDRDGMLRLVDGRIVQAFNADSDRQDYNG